jgi:hypothetical protein
VPDEKIRLPVALVSRVLVKIERAKAVSMNGSISPRENDSDPGRALLRARDDRAAENAIPNAQEKLKD